MSTNLMHGQVKQLNIFNHYITFIMTKCFFIALPQSFQKKQEINSKPPFNVNSFSTDRNFSITINLKSGCALYTELKIDWTASSIITKNQIRNSLC